jgi:hypothetical protein
VRRLVFKIKRRLPPAHQYIWWCAGCKCPPFQIFSQENLKPQKMQIFTLNFTILKIRFM